MANKYPTMSQEVRDEKKGPSAFLLKKILDYSKSIEVQRLSNHAVVLNLN